MTLAQRVKAAPRLLDGGKVAVIYSPGYGAGWYTWNTQLPEILFDPDIVAAVLAKDLQKATRIAEQKYPDIYTGGLDQAVVIWIAEGVPFRITEYDGSESVEYFDIDQYFVP